MDKVLSARVDEAVLDEMNRITGKLRISKRQFLEEAIRSRRSRKTEKASGRGGITGRVLPADRR